MPRPTRPHKSFSNIPLSVDFEVWDGVPVGDGAADFDEKYPYRVVIQWDLFDGRYEPSDVRVRTVRVDLTGPITGKTLRAITLAKFVDRARGQMADLPGVNPEPWEKGETNRLGIEHYQRVADVYKQAFAAGASPTKVVAEVFDQNYSTAASWVARARKHGLLGPASMGKKGI